MSIDKITIKGAKEHNLKNVNLEIPRDKLVVFTGVSGSGKSSLAFDTIYADGQRRYVESLSSYARQFLGQMEKPNVDYIDGLSPAISIDQKTTNKNPRSTVGTVTEIYDYLRLLYARIGIPHCTICGKEISQQTVDQMVDKILQLPEGSKIQIIAPIIRGKKGEHIKELEKIKKDGFVRVRVDGIIYDVSEEIKLDKNKKHTIEVIVDRLVIKNDIISRLTDSIETTVSLSDGIVLIDVIDGEELLFSQNYACAEHGVSIEEISTRMFSFNNPMGACDKCSGLGTFMRIDESLVIPDNSLSINQGAIKVSGWNFSDKGDNPTIAKMYFNALSKEYNFSLDVPIKESLSINQGAIKVSGWNFSDKGDNPTIAKMYFNALSKEYNFSLDVPIKELDKKILDIILYGTKGKVLEMQHSNGVYKSSFEGVINNLERRYKETQSEYVRNEISQSMSIEVCPKCKGDRLKDIALSITINDVNISKLSNMNITEIIKFISNLKLNEKKNIIALPIIKEIKARLGFLENVGLDYLSLLRASSTLSGGESQRIRLATQIGSSLVGVLYILDEPSIGLHQKDNNRLIDTLKKLRDLGNTVIVVEHDEDTIKEADCIVDVGPGAGVHGGEIVFCGTYEDILNCEDSKTGQYLSGRKKIEVPLSRRKGNGNKLIVKGAKENNLKNVNVEIPLGCFTCVMEEKLYFVVLMRIY